MALLPNTALLELWLPMIRDVQSSRYSSLVSSMIIVYDHLITFDQEVELVWKAPWTTGKFMFLLNRYYPLCCVIFNNYVLFTGHLSDELCLSWFKWQGWTGLVACMIAEIILQLRLYALYFLDKRILAFMFTSFIVTSAAAATVIGFVLSNLQAKSHFIPGIPACIPVNLPDYLWAFWIPVVAFESLLCGMALYRGFQAFRYRHSVFQSGRQLVTILLRDSIIYYLILFVAYLTNILLWSTGQIGLIELPVGFTIAMSCVMGNRLILNVRHLKREMEASIEGREKSILQLPFTVNDASGGGVTPSIVIFAQSTSMVLSSDSESAFEYMEMRDVRPDSRIRDSASPRPIVTI